MPLAGRRRACFPARIRIVGVQQVGKLSSRHAIWPPRQYLDQSGVLLPLPQLLMAENAFVRETTRNTSPRGDRTVAAHTAKNLPAEG
jgi:hypothetical protein